MPRFPLTLISSACLALLAAAPTFAAGYKPYDPNVTVEVKGTYEASTSSFSGVGDTSSVHLQWSETATGPLDDIAFGATSGSTAHGAISVSYSASGQVSTTWPEKYAQMACKGSFTAVPGSILATLGPGSTGNSIQVLGTAAFIYSYIDSDQTGNDCAVGPAKGTTYAMEGSPEQTSKDPDYDTFVNPGFTTEAGAGPVTREFSFSDAGNAGSGTGSSKGSETITFLGAPERPGYPPLHRGEPAGGSKKAPKQPGSGKGKSKKDEKAQRRRRQIKEQAKADLGPALEDVWAAHGLSGLLGVGAGAGLGAVADDIGGAALTFEGNDAVTRAVNDYRIVKDPPRGNFKKLAKPPKLKSKPLPSCARFQGAEASFCASLRAAATRMVADSASAAAITDALVTTIDRDTAAIRARAYGVAESQAAHAAALHAQLRKALTAQGKAGGSVAALLRQAQVQGALTEPQAAAAIEWLRAQMAKHGVSPSSLSSLAGAALAPRALDALDALTHPG